MICQISRFSNKFGSGLMKLSDFFLPRFLTSFDFCLDGNKEGHFLSAFRSGDTVIPEERDEDE